MSNLQWLLAHRLELLTAALAVVVAASALVKAAEKLCAVLLEKYPQLKGVDDELKGIAAFLDGVASSPFLNFLSINRKVEKPIALDKPKGGAILLVVLGLGLLAPSPARASGFDWATGPSIPLLQYTLGEKAAPVQLAPGAGVQVSITHSALQQEFAGRTWNLVSLNALAFGSLVTSPSGQQFGRLSVALAPCFMSSLVCVGAGVPLVAQDASLGGGKPFLLLSLNFNFMVSPALPSSFDAAQWKAPAANTLFLAG